MSTSDRVEKAIEKAPEIRQNMINIGSIPEECDLDPVLLMASAMLKQSPCRGCHHDRDKCGGAPYGQEYVKPEDAPVRKPTKHTPASMFGSTGAGGPNEFIEALQRQGGDPIQDMEKRGIRELRDSDVLPSEGSVCPPERWPDDPVPRAWLEERGFELGEPFKDDPIFVPCKFPEGWTKKPSETNPYYWTDVIDQEGTVRLSMFYKAAIHDRSAWLKIITRYIAECPVGGERDSVEVLDRQEDKVLYVQPIDPYPPSLVGKEPDNFTEEDRKASGEWHRKRYEAIKEAEAWIEDHYPGWKEGTAYWTR